ncbi:MAG: CHAP domain-containing protein [Candidatus Dormibacteria bacterium]|jgi:surface antigen
MAIRGLRHRLLRHAWVLLIALLLPVIAPRLPVGASLTSAAPSVQVLNAVIEGAPGDATVPTGPALTVMAPAGATVDSLAASYDRNPASIIWANGFGPGVEPQAGAPVLLPPGPGALVMAQNGELPSQFATAHGIDPSVLLAYNVLQEDTPLTDGSYLQVPLADAPQGSLNPAAFVPTAASTPEVPPSHGGDSFPYGECTYYVATRRSITWGGNAGEWWQNARSSRPEGEVPVAGAVVVFEGPDYSYDGHVAFVDSVNANGSFVIEEMNYDGWGAVDERTVQVGDPSIVGFIY